MRRALMTLALLTAALPACARGCVDDGRVTVVASIYPLAFAAQWIGGPQIEVIDLTPPGVEAHDVELSFRDRTLIAEADIVAYLGQIGFQPQVELAVRDACGVVVDYSTGGRVRSDPHVWLGPGWLEEAGESIHAALREVDPDNADLYDARYRQLFDADNQLFNTLVAGLDPTACRYDTAIVTHEAFGELFPRGIRQVGLTGIVPEGEPTSASLDLTSQLIRAGKAGAIFFEDTEEGRRIATPVARDLAVPALPLSTLESAPEEGDYLSVMRANLASLREGLACR